MKKLTILIGTLFLLAGLALEAVEPREALADFKDSAKRGDFEAVWKKMLKIPNISPEGDVTYREKVNKDMARFKEGADFVIIDHKIDGDCAVVLVNEIKESNGKGANYDPIYLLKQDGEWKFFPNFSIYRQAAQIAPDNVETFKRLQVWYDKREEIAKSRP